MWSVYFYAVVLAGPGASGTFAAHALINLALFLVFAAHHSLLARAGMKRALTRVVPPDAVRTVYVWIASVLWLLVCVRWQSLPGIAYAIDGIGRWLLYATQLGGMLITL